MSNAAAVFASAEQDFVAGRLEESRRRLLEVIKLTGDQPAVLHLLALVEKKQGKLDASADAFERALRSAPTDPQIHGNYANLLADLGRSEKALDHYERAVALAPTFAGARLNRALHLQRMGRLEDALEELDALSANAASDARVHSARASVLRGLGRLDEAATAYDRAIALDPNRTVALHGRARIAMERGEPGAAKLYETALAKVPGNRELLLGLCEALEADGESRGLSLLADAVGRSPDWAEGHEVLARMRAEAGAGPDFADHFRRSIEQRPDDRALRLSHCRTLAAAEFHQPALDATREALHRFPGDRDFVLLQAMLGNQCGDPKSALAECRRHPSADQPDYLVESARSAFQLNDCGQAAELLDRVIAIDPGNIAAWAYLDIAWRMLDDERHAWLSGQPNLHSTRMLGLSDAEIADIAQTLRQLHRTRAHPIGQSLRGGTQTRGRLFDRTEPQVRLLREAIQQAVADHVRNLPPADPAHPLLRHRDRPFAITGSWSVRLTGEGFHVSHVHPLGHLSSACYLAVPAAAEDADPRSGWLELGRPPAEIRMNLEPLAMVEPRPGLLALFPSYLFHGTRPFRSGERLTAAFDAVAVD